MAAPIGNQNAAKGKQWSLAIDRALAKRSKKAKVDALDMLAEKLLERCDDGDMQALKELGDRLEGKPASTVDIGNKNNDPFMVGMEWKDSAAFRR